MTQGQFHTELATQLIKNETVNGAFAAPYADDNEPKSSSGIHLVKKSKMTWWWLSAAKMCSWQEEDVIFFARQVKLETVRRFGFVMVKL